ncbi:MAG: hypothetical protein J0I47_05840 [Sphingomonas sp.]|uniref:hypothetical protein n=1 Tax=Sphingomonas sp. TaxID=28214 RepID=UPI001AC459C9|nr:hypothetical protein [Sphingomonas sp.]MBN8807741.1 hypothetical protein [Sphingomonas sp.]
MKAPDCAAIAAATMLCASPAFAQDAAVAGTRTYLPDSVSPFGLPKGGDAAGDGSAVTMPKLDFKGDGTEAADFDKYYVFHRDNTTFATAYADLAECDGYARGLQSGIAYQQAPYPYTYTMAGAVGGALANVMVAAIFGSGEKRRARRTNMRTCMHFKGYGRYGLPKAVWEPFNFEEGLGSVSEEKRQVYLRQQAAVASTGVVQGKDLGL